MIFFLSNQAQKCLIKHEWKPIDFSEALQTSLDQGSILFFYLSQK